MVVACSHGHLADPSALKAVLDFKKKWNPELTWHAGDFLDLAALRSGASGTKDEAEDLVADFNCGFDFLNKLEPQKIFLGNHEHRITELINHPNAMKSYACTQAYNSIQDVAKKLKAEIVQYDIETGWRPIGDALVGHGYMYNKNAIQDHAETFGKCIIGHLHHVGESSGATLKRSTAYCTGTLANIPAMSYARRRKATLRWSHGFAFGEYSNDESVIWLQKKTNSGEWRNPIGC